MEITLEKMDLVKERTGVSYKEAKEALEAANGDVVDAIIALEEGEGCCGSEEGRNWTEFMSTKGTEVVDKVKELVKTGNVTRIRIKKDDLVILDLPVTAGAVGMALIGVQLTAIAAVVALITKCTIEVQRPDKATINVSDMINNKTEEMTEKIKNKVEDIKDDMKDKFQ